MYIESYSNNGYKYLRLVESVSYGKTSGKKGCKKNVIKTLGRLDKFDDGKPDYVDRLKKSFKLGKPLIEELSEYCNASSITNTYKFTINELSDECFGDPKIVSNILLENYLEQLGINSFVSRYKQLTKIQYDLLGFIRLLIFGRIYNPTSKIGTTRQNDDYYTPILKEGYNKYNVYDTLDFVYEHKNKLNNRINNEMTKKFGRTTDAIYYDCTNFYFETQYPDVDLTNEDNGEIIEKGIRKTGVSKEYRPNPIVQMGMFIDDQGVPISIKMFPGNTLDHQTVIPSLDETISDLNYKRFIFVGDRGMYKGTNTFDLIQKGHGYVVSKSIEKTQESEKAWIFDDSEYTSINNGTFKYKSRTFTRKVKDENSKMQKITEKVVVYWSKKHYDRQIYENKTMLEFLEKFKENPTSFKLGSLNKSMKKFIKKEFIDNKTGEIKKDSDFTLIIDEDKVNKYKQSFGYYQIVSSEHDKSELEIINIYRGLSRIEDQFRTLKGNLDARPIYVTTKEHIEAHLFICMISLTIIRLIQNKITDYQKTIGNLTDDNGWSNGLSSERLIRALSKWQLELIADDYYRFNGINDTDLNLLLNSYDIRLKKKLYKKMEIKTIKTSIKVTL